MYRNFKIDGNDILNIYELQDNFSLGKIYSNIEQFKIFAKVHCKPLVKSYYDSDKKLNIASRFDNSFWFDVLCGEEDKTEYSGYVEYLSGDEKNFAEGIKKHCRHKEIEEEIIEECKAFQLKEKIKYLFEKIPKELNSKQNILKLLAICELSHINALEVKDFTFKKEDAISKINLKGIKFFPDKKSEIVFDTANKPYRYWYHCDDKLADGEKIKTVKIKAVGVPGKKVVIELYSDKDEKLVDSRVINKDGFIYCNIAGGKIIKFLPDVDAALSKCSGYSKEDKRSIRAAFLKKNVGVFAIGNKEYGYLTAENGKLNCLFYKPARNNEEVEFRLCSIFDNVVELKFTQNGYQILTDKGTVIDKKTEKNVKAVSLER